MQAAAVLGDVTNIRTIAIITAIQVDLIRFVYILAIIVI
jgi:hypothetical protein